MSERKDDMNDEEQRDLWAEMDAGLKNVLAEDKALAEHGAIPREALEIHMREEHGVVAQTKLVLEPIVGDERGRVRENVIPLAAVGESQLRAGHWRLHELGKGHRP